VERQAVRRQFGRSGGQDRPQQESVEADLESYCLSALLQRPGLLHQINESLLESRLEAVLGKDFQNTGNRAIYETWQEIITTDASVPIEALREQLPEDLHARLEEILAPDKSTLADDQLARDVLLTILRLRERSLKRLGQELRFLTLEAHEAGDLRAEAYIGALRSYKETLLRTQQALAQH
jgi:hypothetical protein